MRPSPVMEYTCLKALIQRVSESHVVVDGSTVGAINAGLLVLLGVEQTDNTHTADKLLHKLLRYRLFPDEHGKMNLSVQDTGGGILLISQFTLAADTHKGLRPSFSSAAEPEQAQVLYQYCVDTLRQLHATVATGIFAANMQVHLINDGPVTFLLDS